TTRKCSPGGQPSTRTSSNVWLNWRSSLARVCVSMATAWSTRGGSCNTRGALAALARLQRGARPLAERRRQGQVGAHGVVGPVALPEGHLDEHLVAEAAVE